MCYVAFLAPRLGAECNAIRYRPLGNTFSHIDAARQACESAKNQIQPRGKEMLLRTRSLADAKVIEMRTLTRALTDSHRQQLTRHQHLFRS